MEKMVNFLDPYVRESYFDILISHDMIYKTEETKGEKMYRVRLTSAMPWPAKG